MVCQRAIAVYTRPWCENIIRRTQFRDKLTSGNTINGSPRMLSVVLKLLYLVLGRHAPASRAY